VAVIAALIAYRQRSQKIAAENETRQVAAFFDPKDDSVTMPPNPYLYSLCVYDTFSLSPPLATT
jgi:hypothetical protein